MSGVVGRASSARPAPASSDRRRGHGRRVAARRRAVVVGTAAGRRPARPPGSRGFAGLVAGALAGVVAAAAGATVWPSSGTNGSLAGRWRIASTVAFETVGAVVAGGVVAGRRGGRLGARPAAWAEAAVCAAVAASCAGGGLARGADLVGDEAGLAGVGRRRRRSAGARAVHQARQLEGEHADEQHDQHDEQHLPLPGRRGGRIGLRRGPGLGDGAHLGGPF